MGAAALILVAVISTLATARMWWLARSAARRITLLTLATARVRDGDLAVRVRPRGNDEIDALMQSFNLMVAQMQLSQSRVEYLQRIGAWQDFARRLAHEIKNPLTPIQLAIQEVARKYPGGDEAFTRSLTTAREVIEEEVETLRRLVAAFSEFARLPDVKTAPGDLAQFVRDAADNRAFLDEAAQSVSEVMVHFEAGEVPLPVVLDRILLRRVLDNLVRNAVEAGAREVWVRAERHDEQAWLIVDDDGPGIAANVRDRVFEPYVTTKGTGTGLGLAIVRKIAFDHRGDVGFEPRTPHGTRFVVTLPLENPLQERRLSFVTFSGTRPDAPLAPVPLEKSDANR